MDYQTLIATDEELYVPYAIINKDVEHGPAYTDIKEACNWLQNKVGVRLYVMSESDREEWTDEDYQYHKASRVKVDDFGIITIKEIITE